MWRAGKFFLPPHVAGWDPALHVLYWAERFMMQLHIWLGKQLFLFKRSFQNWVRTPFWIENCLQTSGKLTEKKKAAGQASMDVICILVICSYTSGNSSPCQPTCPSAAVNCFLLLLFLLLGERTLHPLHFADGRGSFPLRFGIKIIVK